MTAAELDELLHSCPEWVEQDRLRREKREAAEARFRIEEESIISDIAAAGYQVESVYDLVNTKASYPAAIFVLINHLPRPYHPRIRQGIARALTVREARGVAGGAILAQLVQESDPETRWTLANALTVVATRLEVDQIAALAGDPAYEQVHERLGKALKTAMIP